MNHSMWCTWLTVLSFFEQVFFFSLLCILHCKFFQFSQVLNYCLFVYLNYCSDFFTTTFLQRSVLKLCEFSFQDSRQFFQDQIAVNLEIVPELLDEQMIYYKFLLPATQICLFSMGALFDSVETEYVSCTKIKIFSGFYYNVE